MCSEKKRQSLSKEIVKVFKKSGLCQECNYVALERVRLNILREMKETNESMGIDLIEEWANERMVAH